MMAGDFRKSGARLLSGVLIAVSTLSPASAQAPGQEDPDWPCIQRKIASLTPAAIWTGPPIEEAVRAEDPRLDELVARLAQRRLPVDEANAEIESFAAALPPETKRETLVALFAGLFESLNAERSDVMEGIGRYGHNQKALAEAIREKAAKLDRLEQDPEADPTQISALREELAWDNRIFEERRASLSYVCEVPRLIEQRLFALARTIEAVLPAEGAPAGN